MTNSDTLGSPAVNKRRRDLGADVQGMYCSVEIIVEPTAGCPVDLSHWVMHIIRSSP